MTTLNPAVEPDRAPASPGITTGFQPPDTFIVGAPKCATTSMYYYLKQHPDVFMSVPKEPLYFGSDLSSHRIKTRNFEEYRSFFEGADDAERVGEASPWYLYSTRAAREIHDFNPEARIVILLRHPVDAMHALHSQNLYSGNETVEDFRKALRLEDRRKRGREIPVSTHFPDALFYREVYRYPPQVRRYLEVFDRERVKILLLDDLKHDARACYRELLDFLGLRAVDPPRFEPHNRNCRFKSDLLRGLVQRLPGHTKETLRNLFSVRPWVDLWKVLEPMLVEHRSRPSLDPDFRRELLDDFREDIRSLSRLIRRDLSDWLNA